MEPQNIFFGLVGGGGDKGRYDEMLIFKHQTNQTGVKGLFQGSLCYVCL